MTDRRKSSLLVVLLLWSAPALAGPPTLDHLFPAGGRAGTTVEVEAGGKFDRWPVRAWVDGDGLTVEAGETKGKLRFAIAEDATAGLRWLRLVDDEGASAPRPFLVGTLDEVAEAEPNDRPAEAQEVELSPGVVVNGRLAKRGDVDGYRVQLSRGMTLVAALEANDRLGSPMDGVLQVVSPEGFVLAQVDDDGGRDPLLVYRAEADGPAVVRLFAFPATPDSTINFAGGEAFVYRLTLTAGGYLDYAHPLAVAADSPGPIEAIGWKLLPEQCLTSVPAGEPGEVVVADPHWAGLAEVRREPHPVVLEADEPPMLPVPGTACGRVDPPGDRDAFRFEATKDRAIELRVESRVLGRPLDAVLRVLGPDGKELAEADDEGGRGRRSAPARGDGRDPVLAFKPPADGTYTVEVRDRNDVGGPRHAYLLRATPIGPEFRLALEADRFNVAKGKPAEIAVKVERVEGYAEPIAVGVEGLVPGATVYLATSEPTGDSSKAVTLKPGLAGPWSGPIRVVGRPASEAAGSIRLGRLRLGLADPPGPPRVASAPIEGREASTEQVWLAIPAP